MHHTQIAQRAFNTPLMLDPSKALAFLSGLGPRITGQKITFADADLPLHNPGQAARPARAGLITGTPALKEGGDIARPFTLTDGIAVIEIAGTLVHRGAWIGQSSGITSYEGLAAQIDAAVADPDVLGLALDIDSFGGEVAGAFDLADRIRAARAVKPVHAFVAEHALSAGYALASQADHITLPRTGAAGSIGVVVLHAEMSGMLEQKGMAVTLIHAGARKTEANPYEPLPAEVRDRMQAELEDLRHLFAETVVAGRGDRLSIEAALGTEAAVFRGSDAVTAGLADVVADPRTGFRAFAESLSAPRIPAQSNPTQTMKEPLMSSDTTTDACDSAAHAVQPAAATPDATAPSNPPVAAAPAAPAGAAAPAEPPVNTEPVVPAAAASPEAIRAEAAEVAQICAQAARLGVSIDAADAVRRSLKPDALRSHVLSDLAARGDATAIVATPPAVTAPKLSPIIAAAQKSAGTC
ncbi:S49 family peptidase [Sedimentitalea arenosa]|uniref:S49 family peptidase n=1 Tax=Sedimentitalea arenosa TaxID=2798803 RepID=A0A8J7LWY5_9RHOB|nr:S49 family peptidase [Arenibacterium arenosum]MBJ6372750.1 S49 family peptidase [Arenibacterium arenosum]